jgi:signal transduction histidine kinase
MPELPGIEADATLVLRALANLLENAQRHAGGVRSLRARVTQDFVVFEVQDAGPGFSPGEERRVFQPFRRGEAATSGGVVGLGLGLSLVQRIAEAHGGTTFAENRAGGGASVGFTIPLPRHA